MSEVISNGNGKTAKPKSGLEDIVAATSEICFIDGKQGRLVYRGYDINDIVAGGATFEETVYLLWFGKFPNKQELREFRRELSQHRRLPREVVSHLFNIPTSAPPMEALRTAVSELALYQESEQMSREATSAKPFTCFRKWQRLSPLTTESAKKKI